MLLLLILEFVSCFIYSFEATQQLLLIELFSLKWMNMTIEIAENQIIQSQLSQDNTQYMQMYFKLEVGAQYILDITLNPSDNYSISQESNRDCQNNCSSNGICQSLKCICNEMIAGYKYDKQLSDRCQYNITIIDNLVKQQKFDIQSYQTIMTSIQVKPNEFLDDQGQIKKIRVSATPTIQGTVYFLMPFEQPYKVLNYSKQIYDGEINVTDIDYSSKYSQYSIKTVNYQFILLLQNTQQNEMSYQITYQFLSNEESFQDFILVVVLSVVSFIILLVIIYIIKRRCQYMIETNKKDDSKNLDNHNYILDIMPEVEPVKDQECIICLEKLELRICKQTPCKHIIHTDCLGQWLEKQQNCPLCREPFFDEDGAPKFMKTKNQTTLFLQPQQGQSLVQSDRNSVRSMILFRSRQSRLAMFQ